MVDQKFPLILQLDANTGTPARWITYELSAYYDCKGLIAWSIGEVEFDLHGGINLKTGKQSILTVNTIVAIKSGKSGGKHLHHDRVPLTNRTLFRRDWNICAYCGTEMPSAKLTRDHVTPSSAGGLNKWENVVTACSGCNKRKDSRTPEQAHMSLLYVPYRPNRNEYLILSNRNVLACQMDFLAKNLPKESRIHVYGKERLIENRAN